jgi:hypothetical protein
MSFKAPVQQCDSTLLAAHRNFICNRLTQVHSLPYQLPSIHAFELSYEPIPLGLDKVHYIVFVLSWTTSSGVQEVQGGKAAEQQLLSLVPCASPITLVNHSNIT